MVKVHNGFALGARLTCWSGSYGITGWTMLN